MGRGGRVGGGGGRAEGGFVKIQRSGPDNSAADKQNKRRPDIRRRVARARDSMALQFHLSSIPGGNPSDETKASNANKRRERESGREFGGVRAAGDIIRRNFCHRSLPRVSDSRRRGKRSRMR